MWYVFHLDFLFVFSLEKDRKMKMLSNPTTNQLISSLFQFNDWKISTIFYQKILQYFYCCHHRRRHRYRRKQYLLIDDHNNNNNNNEYNNDGNDNFINHHHHYCQTFKSSMFMLKHPWQTLCFIIQIFILIGMFFYCLLLGFWSIFFSLD